MMNDYILTFINHLNHFSIVLSETNLESKTLLKYSTKPLPLIPKHKMTQSLLLPLFFFFFSFSFFFSVTHSQSKPDNCSQSCGPHQVPYPFGFSPSCAIQLTCAADSIIQLAGLRLQNITPDTILLELPPLCNRSIRIADNFFSRNFALTRKNGFFLRNCSANSTSGCVIPTELISDQLRLHSCGSKSDNLTCIADPKPREDKFASPGLVNATGCDYLFTSVRYEVESGNLSTLVVWSVELGWWVEGTHCRCSPNANCTPVNSAVGRGFRCSCRDGFKGSGFTDDDGCYQDRGRSNKIALVGGLIAGVSLMAGIALLLCLIKHRCTSLKLRKYAKPLYSEVSFTVPFYSYREIERATEKFSENRQLGTGAYGTVYAGQLEDGELVAVKRIKRPDPETIDQVINEVKMISSLDHPNLIRLLGCCIEKGEQILLYEFMLHGTLSQHLQRQRGSSLPWTVRLNIAAETAKAIAYLHSAVEPPIYHRDIKSCNILLDHHFNAKIADFGLSRAVITETSHISTAPQGTPGYVDPQYHQNYHLSDKSDVYSFGVVLMEIITGLKAVDLERAQSEINLAAMAVDRISKGRLEEIIDPFLKVQKRCWASESIGEVAELAFRCLAFYREMRPSMMEVADDLEQIKLSVWAPKDGEVILQSAVEACSSLTEGTNVSKDTDKSKRLVLVNEIGRMEDFCSPISVQDPWVSKHSTPSNSN